MIRILKNFMTLKKINNLFFGFIQEEEVNLEQNGEIMEIENQRIKFLKNGEMNFN